MPLNLNMLERILDFTTGKAAVVRVRENVRVGTEWTFYEFAPNSETGQKNSHLELDITTDPAARSCPKTAFHLLFRTQLGCRSA